MKLRQELINFADAANQLKKEQTEKERRQILFDWCDKFAADMRREAKQGNNEHVWRQASPFGEDFLPHLKSYFEDVTITYTALTEEDGEVSLHELRFQW